MTWLFLPLSLMASFPGAAPWSHVVAQGSAAREAAEQALRLLGRTGVREGQEALARRLERLAARYGVDVSRAAARAGPDAIRLMELAGVRGEATARLLSQHGEQALWIVSKPARLQLVIRHGDQVASALMQHRTLAEPLIKALGAPAARALIKLSPRNARRLAILLEDGTLSRIGRTDQVLQVIEKFGDQALRFLWNNKGPLAVGTVLAAFLLDPEPFLTGARDLGMIAARTVVQPVADLPREILHELTPGMSWSWLAALAVVALALPGYRSLRGKFRR
jgi:hypothetical protein